MNKAPHFLMTILLTAALSGCMAQSGDGGEPLDTSGSRGTTASTNTSSALGDPPRAEVIVLIDGNLTEPDRNGTISAAAGTNITFDASASTGDNLTHAWDFGDGETIGDVPDDANMSEPTPSNTSEPTTSPTPTTTGPTTTTALMFLQQPGDDENSTSGNDSVVTHAYEEEGNYTVHLYVTDDAGRTDMAMIAIMVTGSGTGAGENATVLRVEHKKFADTKTCAATDGVVSPKKTSTFEWIIYENETDGTPSQVANVTIKGGPADTIFLDPDGKEIAKGATIEAEGPFPAGKYKIQASSNCAAGSTAAREHKLDAFATYVAV